MDYIKVGFSFLLIEEYQKDLLIADLAEVGFETFEDTQKGFDAFVQKRLFDLNQLKMVLTNANGLKFDYFIEEIETENWNVVWERNFNPLIINNECYVRATFHEPKPYYAYEIVIDPKMAFGTGHHQTTALMMQYILETDCLNRLVLDMGAGTAILGILAAQKGAKEIIAIDDDEICCQSAIENAKLNKTNNLISLCGNKQAIPDTKFDIILANINRNVLLDQIPRYAEVLNTNGDIFFSGFFENPDLQLIQSCCRQRGLTYINHKKNGEWVAVRFKNC